MAALANGTIGHALDFDDTHLAARLHTTAATLPAVSGCEVRSVTLWPRSWA